MKLPLAGGAYLTRQIAASAQECLNWYPETIEDPTGSGKSTKILRQTPGMHLLVDIDLLHVQPYTGEIRGFWSGGGRCFLAAGAWIYEINNAGGVVSSQNLGLNDTLPVQFAGNFNQLAIVANGYFYLNNGSGFAIQYFEIGGTCDTSGGPPCLAVTRKTGNPFVLSMVGNPIVIDGLTYIVSALVDADNLIIAGGTVGPLTDVLFSAQGDQPVTAVTLAYLASSFYVQRPATPSTIYQTYTDLVIDATIDVNVTSAADPFGAGSIGQALVIKGGLGFRLGTYIIIDVAGVVATLSRTVGTLGSTGGIATEYTTDPDLGRQVAFSGVNDGTSWNGLDFFTKESAPDYIQCIYADSDQLYVDGTESGEVWTNDRNTGRPVPIPGAAMREGNSARYAPVVMNGHTYFIGGSPGGNPVAFRRDGFTPSRISTHAIEEQWATNGEFMSTAIGWWYLEDGHYFWVICFGSGNSWVYDATEKVWATRAKWNPATGGFFQAYRPWFHTYIPEWSSVDGDLNGLHVVGDHLSGKVMIMSSQYYDELGDDMKRVRVLPYIYAGGGKRTYVNRVDLDAATGLVVSGTAPTIELDWSLDNGKTFSAPESAGMGVHDETNVRIFWIAQGSAETAMLPRISLTGQAQTVLIDCEAEVFLGDS